MTTDSFPGFSGWKLRLLVLGMICVISAGARSEHRSDTVPDSTLLSYSRSSLNLSLCSVVFAEEFGDAVRADLYQAGSVTAERMIRDGTWTEEEVILAHDLVMKQDFSFTLPPEMTWSSFRRAQFTEDFCNKALAQVAKERK